jgi:hypothetical protein
MGTVAIALILVSLSGCAPMTYKNYLDEDHKDMAEGVTERAVAVAIKAIEHRLLPMWAAGASEYSVEGIAGLLALFAAYQKWKRSNESSAKEG